MDKKIIAELEYKYRDQNADKNILVNDISSIERQDSNTITVKMKNGHTLYVSPKVGQELDTIWRKTVDEVVTIKAE